MREGDKWALRAMEMSMGRVMAVTPALFKKADMKAMRRMEKTSRRVSLAPALLMIEVATRWAKPVAKVASPSMNRPTMVRMLVSPKLTHASLTVMTPSVESAQGTRMEVTARGIHSVKKSTAATKSTPKTMYTWGMLTACGVALAAYTISGSKNTARARKNTQIFFMKFFPLLKGLSQK